MVTDDDVIILKVTYDPSTCVFQVTIYHILYPAGV
jgi:hypothetical protein